MARPKSDKMTVQFSLRLPIELVKQLDVRIADLSSSTGLTISRGNAVRAAVESWLAKEPKKK